MTTDLERDFAAWADRRDPDALTRVFDATAGRLLLLAAHVAAPRATAEDLVQATFLAAMGRASTWDRSQPVWPWLAAILQNEARMEWRRQRRRREVGIEETGIEPEAAHDPATVAASNDLFDAIVAAIDGLSPTYRNVLRLRLVHGLAHIEIARALELPVGTVRARVHRGLARLRQTLPAGGSALAVAALLTGDGALLAQVRARVLAEAGAMPAAGTAAAATASRLLTGGLWTMNAKTVGLLASGVALLLLLGAWWAFPPSHAGGAGDRAPAPFVADLETRAPASDGGAAAPERTPLGDEDGPAWPLVGVVRSRAGEPIAGARIEVSVAPVGIEQLADRFREVLAELETGADGTFRCDLDALRTRSALFRGMSLVWVRAARDGRTIDDDVLSLPRETEPRRFEAELVLSASIDLVGQVVDEAGAPVAGASLYSISPDGARVAELRARTSDDGSFRIPVEADDLRRPGHLAASDPARGTGTVPWPDPAEARADGTVLDLGTVVLTRRASIRGRVVLGDGSALGEYPVRVYAIDPDDGGGPDAARRAFFAPGPQRAPNRFDAGRLVRSGVRTTTAADGSFAVSALDPDLAYAVAVRDGCLRPITATARPDGDPVRLVVDRQLVLVDVRGDSGETFPGATVLAEGFDPDFVHPPDRIRPGFPPQSPRVHARFYPADRLGRRMLLSPFGWTWRIGPTDAIARPNFVRHDALEGAHRAQVDLFLQVETRFGSVGVEVVDEDGEPFEPFDARLHSLDREASRYANSLGPGTGAEFVDVPAGRWRIALNAGAQRAFPLEIWTRGSHEREIRVEDGGRTEVRIEVPRAGLVAVRPASDPPPDGGAWKGLTIRAEDGARLDVAGYDPMQPAPAGLPIDRDGLLFIAKRAFPPGAHALVVEAEGYLPARCEVQVEVDRLVEVPVKLRRR